VLRDVLIVPTTRPFTVPDLVAAEWTYAQAVDAVVDDIDRWWSVQYPATFDGPYARPAGGVVGASPGESIPACGSRTLEWSDVAGNALYCPAADMVVFDDHSLFPRLFDEHGPAAIGMVAAHEWGHAVQQRAGLFGRLGWVKRELQADCFAGAWLAHANTEGVGGSQVNVGEALAASFDLRDPLGLTALDEGAHGSAFDRLAAVSDGFRGGPAACADQFGDGDVVTYQLPWNSATDALAGGDMPLDELLPAVGEALSEWVSSTFPGARPGNVVGSDSPAAAGCRVVQLASWCDGANVVVVDVAAAQTVVDQVGDFAVGFVAVQAYVAGTGVGDVWCRAGQWTGWLHQATLAGTGPFVLSPGDIDEVAAVVLWPSSAGRADRDPDVDGSFDRLDRVRAGLLSNCGGPAASV
jgi:hypothetical protein